jgi:hypothetical protein
LPNPSDFWLLKTLLQVIFLLLKKIMQGITTMSDNPESAGKDVEKTRAKQGENEQNMGNGTNIVPPWRD